MRIRITAKGECVVTAPRRVPLWMIKKLVEQKTDWIAEHVAKAKSQPVSLLHGGTKEDYERLKKLALGLAQARLDHFNNFYKLAYKKITIRNQTTRWGSCTSNGTLSFNYRIVLLDQAAADYIIVHELCHVAQMNHSAKFWALVEQTVPGYKVIRKKLRGLVTTDY